MEVTLVLDYFDCFIVVPGEGLDCGISSLLVFKLYELTMKGIILDVFTVKFKVKDLIFLKCLVGQGADEKRGWE